MIAGKAVLKTLCVSLTLSDNCPKLSIYFRTGLVTVRVFRYGTHSCVQLITTSCATLQQGRGRGFGSSKFSFRTRGTFREREGEREGEEEKGAHLLTSKLWNLEFFFFSVIVVFYYHESESNIWACCFTKHFPQIFLFCLSIHGRLAHESIRHESESVVCGLALSA